jgi:ABC-type nitrate/sulfonate/bicarbonate transport system ATPase subunit
VSPPARTAARRALISVRDLTKTFPTRGGAELPVLEGINPGVPLVFQTFALLPWLTIQQNVELGLEAQGMPPDGRAKRALEI